MAGGGGEPAGDLPRERRDDPRGDRGGDDELFGGGGKATLVHRGLAKVLEDLAEFEVVSDVPPETIRDKVFSAAAEARRKLREIPLAGRRGRRGWPSRPGRRSIATRSSPSVAQKLKLEPETILQGLFADLRDENRLLKFEDMTAQRLIDRYNVALAQAVLLRSVPRRGWRSATRARRGIARSSAGSSSIASSTSVNGTHGRRLHDLHRRPGQPLQRRRRGTASRWPVPPLAAALPTTSASTPSSAGGLAASRGASTWTPAPA